MLTWFCTGSALVHKGRSNLSYTPPGSGGALAPNTTLAPSTGLAPA